jgi:hypothetical protein
LVADLRLKRSGYDRMRAPGAGPGLGLLFIAQIIVTVVTFGSSSCTRH